MLPYNNAALNLLRDAMSIQLALSNRPRWAAELVDRSLPVLWFGNSMTEQQKVITIGANPSRTEFIRVGRSGSPNQFIESPRNRFKVLDHGDDIASRIDDDKFLAEVLRGYDEYFQSNPYKRWFGKAEGGKLEAMMNGLDASFYSGPRLRTGLHIDLFPFATMHDFTTITDVVIQDLFDTAIAQQMMSRLLEILQPSLIIVTGELNWKCARNHFGDLLKFTSEATYISADGRRVRVGFGLTRLGQIPIAAVSLNLGNPHGWSAVSIRGLGLFIGNSIGLGA